MSTISCIFLRRGRRPLAQQALIRTQASCGLRARGFALAVITGLFNPNQFTVVDAEGANLA